MKLQLLNKTQKPTKIASLVLFFVLLFSTHSYADDTNCGHISGFEFSNGNASIAITNYGSYSLSDLPSDFYVDVLVSGFSESASIKIKNLDTGQAITVGENYLPYTHPGGNGAWSYGTGSFEVDAKIFKYANCGGSYCDREKVKFTITNSPACGQIDGLEFSNGTNSVAIADGGSYDLATLPYNFYVDVKVSGMTESAANTITNLDTGAVHTNGENVLPYTYPSGNQAWTLGAGTFQFYSEIFKYDNCAGTKCDHIYVTFTIFEQNCGAISGFEFSNGTDTAAITNGGTYDINALPNNFYIDGIVSGDSESFRFNVKNLETNQTYNIIENYLPYTFPAGNGAWFLGTGTFEVKGSLFSGNYCNATLCDEETITFNITDGPNCGTITGLEFSNGISSVAIENGGNYNMNELPVDFYVNALFSGPSDFARLTLTNVDTSASIVIDDNIAPYTYPADISVWDLGIGNFQIKTELFLIDYSCEDHDNDGYEDDDNDSCDDHDNDGYEDHDQDSCEDHDNDGYEDDDNDSCDDDDNDGYEDHDEDSCEDHDNDGYEDDDNDSCDDDDNDGYEDYDNDSCEDHDNDGYEDDDNDSCDDDDNDGYEDGNSTLTLCDQQIVSFTLTEGPVPCTANAGITVVDTDVVIWTPLANPVVTIIPGADAVLPAGGNFAALISKGLNDAIRFTSVGLSIALEEPGNFKVHLLAYDPTTLDLNSIVLGTTTINDLQNTISTNALCAALDGTGVSLTVINGGTDERVANTKEDSIKGDVKEEVALTVKTEELLSADNNVDIKLYPNPAVDNLNVEILLLDAELMNYKMIDLNGRQVLSGSFDNSTLGKTTVNTSKLSNGLYIITFESNFRSFSKKVQVSH